MSVQFGPKSKRVLLLCIISLLLGGTTTYLLVKNKRYSSGSGFTSQELPHLNPVSTSPQEPTSVIGSISQNQEEKDTSRPKKMAIQQRPTWKLEGNLIAHYETLKEAADKGDDESAHIFAMNLRYCYSGPTTETELEQALENADEYSDRIISTNRITERFRYCQGVNKENRSQFYKYFEIAANQGFVPTQEIIANITPKLFMQSQGYAKLERAEFLKKRDQFIQQKVAYLTSASQQGSFRAMDKLTNMYSSQNYGANGLIKAFALSEVVLKLVEDSRRYNGYSRYQQRLKAKLTPDEIDRGLTMSAELLKAVKENGTLYSF